jgi:hypothetical protein
MLLIGPGLMAALFTAALVAALISTPVLPYEVLPREQVIAVAAIKSGIAWLLAVLAVRLVRLR